MQFANFAKLSIYPLKIVTLNEQVTYKRGVAGPKKMATGINYGQNGCLAKA